MDQLIVDPMSNGSPQHCICQSLTHTMVAMSSPQRSGVEFSGEDGGEGPVVLDEWTDEVAIGARLLDEPFGKVLDSALEIDVRRETSMLAVPAAAGDGRRGVVGPEPGDHRVRICEHGDESRLEG